MLIILSYDSSIALILAIDKFLMDDICYFLHTKTLLFPCLWSKKAFNSIYYGAPYNEKLTRKSFPQWNLKCLWRGKKQESRDVSIIISLINDIFLRHCWTVPYVLKTSGRFRPRHKSNKSNHRILSLEQYSEHLCLLCILHYLQYGGIKR